MPDQLQLRGGTTTEHNSFTGVTREVTVDTTKKTLVVHDGSTQGGVPLMRESGGNDASAVSIGTGGNNVININGSQKVGIGTTSPDQKLHVHNGSAGSVDSTASSVLTLENSNNATLQFLCPNNKSAQLRFGDPEDNGAGYIDYDHNQSRLSFATNGPEKMRIDSSGRVLIGTTSTTGTSSSADDIIIGSIGDNTDRGITLATSGVGSIRWADDGDNAMGRISYSNSSDYMFFATGNEQRMGIDSSGNVGIGTTSPARRLHLNGSDSNTVQLHITNSTTGATGNDGVSFALGSDESLIINQRESNHIALKTDDTERMRIDSSGNVGIGTSSPTHMLDISGSNPILALNDTDTTNDRFRLTYNGGSTQLQVDPNNVRSGSHLLVAVDGSERMRITSSGNVGIGTSSPSSPFTVSDGNQGFEVHPNSSSTVRVLAFDRTNSVRKNLRIDALEYEIQCNNGTEKVRIDSSGRVGIGTSPVTTYKTTIQEDTSQRGVLVLDRTSDIDSTFRDNVSFRRSGAEVGTIKCNNSGTQYNTSSDYRLKENVVTISNATDRLKQLQPKRFNFILNPDTTVDGFLAHEVQSVVPEAISGTKDEVDSDNNPIYQGIDQSKLVPLLTAALQEAITKIETLETKVAALEAA